MIRNVFAVALFALIASPALAQRGGYPPQFEEGVKEHVFKQAGDVELKLYVFEPADRQPSDKTPAIVFFFGGGWVGGSPEQFAPQSRYLASRGMVAIVADYRVKNRHGVKGVDCVRDAKSAIRWVRAHAAELGVDPDRIAASGGSAGGHLAAATGTIKEFDEPSEEAAVSSVPNAMILYNPAASFDPATLIPGEKRGGNFGARMGVEPSKLSPAAHIDAKTPPTLIMIGTDDYLIGGARQFADRMKAAGARCDLDLYQGRGHGFFNLRPNKPSKDFYATTKSLDRFLTSLGYLEGEQTVKEFFKK
jgi:acetyl esterase/lipase